MAKEETENIYIGCLRLLLKPVVSFCLQRSITIQDVIESLKVVFVDIATKQLEARGEEVTASRICVSSGIHRKEVGRIQRREEIKSEPMGLSTKVIGHWQTSKRYTTKDGKPRVLSLQEGENEFVELVQELSKDVYPASVLFDLERIGAVEHTRNGLKLVAKEYNPRVDPIEAYKLLARDATDLMFAVEDNVFSDHNVPHLHARTWYDNVAQEDLERVKKWLLKEGTQFHKRAREFLSQYDLDISPNDKKTPGGRVFIGTFARCADD